MNCPRCNVEINLAPGAITRCIYDNIKCGLTMTERDPIVVEREKTHGNFVVTAKIAQDIKNAIHWGPTDLVPRQHEVLDLIATKIARIKSGDPMHKEHWLDIAGYAKLGAEACE